MNDVLLVFWDYY